MLHLVAQTKVLAGGSETPFFNHELSAAIRSAFERCLRYSNSKLSSSSG